MLTRRINGTAFARLLVRRRIDRQLMRHRVAQCCVSESSNVFRLYADLEFDVLARDYGGFSWPLPYWR
jgi:hypothetical protein